MDLDLRKGESLGISGCNGTGKTLLARALAGQIPVLHQGSFVSVSVPAAFVSFQSAFGMRNGFAAYRQQRWNPID
ncbi:MAG TPA: ATP-binding cassette domain-containing protein, partial [Gammaproteobacteria bacterium]|nr:ATP-binding cassette domain-containing protein [Gammaproteobacteria bacterium]